MSDNRTDIEIIDFSNLPKREPARQEAPRGGQSNDGNTPRRKKKKMTRKQKILQVTGRVFGTILLTLLLLVIWLWGVMKMLCDGPSKTA